jgi:flagellar biosynthetic protein FliP
MNRKILRIAATLFVAVLLVLVLGLPASAAVEPFPPMEPIEPMEPLTSGDGPLTQDEPGVDAGPQLPSQPPAEPGGGPGTIDPNLINVEINGEGSDTIRILLIMTIVSLLPSILLMMTSFTRIVIVFSLIRNAIGLQQTPPNQVMIGLALFLSLFIMNPVITDIYENAYQPYANGEMDAEGFLDAAQAPLKSFMLDQVHTDDLNMFIDISGQERPANEEELSMTVLVPSFIVSEIKRGFTIGFFVYIPFLIIDMVVASALMSMGMMMLPPVTISLPFKLMLFVLIDGWGMLIKTLVVTFETVT